MDAAVMAGLEHELRGDEGEVLHVYDDANGKPIGPGSHVIGNPSIGIGRNLAARGITATESATLLANDLAAAERDLNSALPWITALSAGRQVVLYSLYFNTALGNLRHFLGRWPVFLKQMEAEQYTAAADNLATSEPWASQVGPRAARLASLVRYG